MNAKRILKAREMKAAGEFNRAITGREPDSVNYDALTLECGHKLFDYPEPKSIFADKEHPYCHFCAEDWLKQDEPR